MDAIANPLYFVLGTSNLPSSSNNVVRFIDILEFFFIAHPPSGRKEGDEHKRVLFFHPKSENIDRQTELTGFAEAVVNFTDNFLQSSSTAKISDYLADDDHFDFRTVSTQRAEHVYIRVENEQFIIGASLSKQLSLVSEYPVFIASLKRILCDAYKMFRLFFGTFSAFRKSQDDTSFKDRLDFFFSRYIPLLKVHKVPLLDYLGGVEFLRMPGSLYLNVVTFISELQEEFPLIEKILFLYQDKLLYYSLSRRDLPALFRYLTQNLLPTVIAPELEPHGNSNKGRFLRGPSDLSTDAPLVGDECLPVVHLHVNVSKNNPEIGIEEEVLMKHQMVIYRCLNATVCMFIRCNSSRPSRCGSTVSNETENKLPENETENPIIEPVISRRLLRNIDSFLELELSTIANKIGDEVGTESEECLRATDFHYIYFNPASLSMTSSLSSFPKMCNTASMSIPTKIPLPPMDVNRLVCDTMSNFISDTEEFGECFVKSDTDWWIVIKKVNSRLLVLLLPPSAYTSSLADVQSKTQVIIKTHFEAIFFS